jgi:predicted dehydrogenase
MRVGVVGTGFGAQVHVPAMQLVPGVEVTGICSAHQSRADAVAAQFSLPFATDDFRSLVQRDDVDLVSVCTPTALHAPVVHAALAAGKHVLCEKPLGIGTVECQELVAAAQAVGHMNALNHELRYLPLQRHLRRLVSDGFLGELRLVTVTLIVDYATSKSNKPYYWGPTVLRSEGGGVLRGVVCHYIDLVRAAFGEVSEVSGWAANQIPTRPVPAEVMRHGGLMESDPDQARRATDADDSLVISGLLGRAPFSLAATWAAPRSSGMRLEAHGSEGVLIADDSLPRLLGSRGMGSGLEEIELPGSLNTLADEAPLLVALTSQLVKDLQRKCDEKTSSHEFATFEDGLATQLVIERIFDLDQSAPSLSFSLGNPAKAERQ